LLRWTLRDDREQVTEIAEPSQARAEQFDHAMNAVWEGALACRSLSLAEVARVVRPQ